MASKKQKESKLQELLVLAQLQRMLEEPGRQDAELAQRAKGQNMQSVLAMLGLTQADKNANADRSFRQEESTRNQGNFDKQFAATQGVKDEEQQYRRERDSVGDFRADEAAQAARENAAVAQHYAGENLALNKDQLAASKEANSMDVFRTLLGLPGADVPTLLKGSPNEALKAVGLGMEDKATSAELAKQRPVLNAVTDPNVRNTIIGSMSPAARSRLNSESTSVFQGPTDFINQFLSNPMSLEDLQRSTAIPQPAVAPQVQPQPIPTSGVMAPDAASAMQPNFGALMRALLNTKAPWLQ